MCEQPGSCPSIESRQHSSNGLEYRESYIQTRDHSSSRVFPKASPMDTDIRHPFDDRDGSVRITN